MKDVLVQLCHTDVVPIQLNQLADLSLKDVTASRLPTDAVLMESPLLLAPTMPDVRMVLLLILALQQRHVLSLKIEELVETIQLSGLTTWNMEDVSASGMEDVKEMLIVSNRKRSVREFASLLVSNYQ